MFISMFFCHKYCFELCFNQVNNVVSGALDRLHYEKDPCVKYDVNKKIWIYLHRNRTQDELGKIYLICIMFNK